MIIYVYCKIYTLLWYKMISTPSEIRSRIVWNLRAKALHLYPAHYDKPVDFALKIIVLYRVGGSADKTLA